MKHDLDLYQYSLDSMPVAIQREIDRTGASAPCTTITVPSCSGCSLFYNHFPSFHHISSLFHLSPSMGYMTTLESPPSVKLYVLTLAWLCDGCVGSSSGYIAARDQRQQLGGVYTLMFTPLGCLSHKIHTYTLSRSSVYHLPLAMPSQYCSFSQYSVLTGLPIHS